MFRPLFALFCIAYCVTSALAQSPPTQAAATQTPAATSGVQAQNIFDVKPDASNEPGYADQSNGERGKVQAGNNAPLWRQVGAGKEAYSSLSKTEAPEAGTLIQPFTQYPGSRLTNAGEAWRQVRNNWIIPYGGALVLIVLGAIGVFYWRNGAFRQHAPNTGRVIERFTPFERSAHWANAIAFSILGISGLVMAFGKFVIQPVIGSALFGWLAFALKNLHNFAGPLFAVSLVIVVLTFIKDNLPAKGDLVWLAKGGGLLSGKELPSGRFNAGEKIIFWGGVFFLGLIVVGSGLVLDKLVPGLIFERSTMQIAHMTHAVATVLMMAMFIGHIYIGTVGMEGAYSAMKTGYVDEAWAKEHHEIWYDDVKSGKIPAQRSLALPPAQTAQI